MQKKVKFICPDCGARLEVVECITFEKSKRLLLNGYLSKKSKLFETIESTGVYVRCEGCQEEYWEGHALFNTFKNKDKIAEIYDEIKFEKEKN